MSEELKPCPFCGGEADVIQPMQKSPYNAYCQVCGCVLFTDHKQKGKAIKAWNRRVNDD